MPSRRRREQSKVVVITRVFQDELHVKDRNDLALALRDVDVTIHRLHARDLGRDIALGGFDRVDKVGLEPLACPF